MIKQLILDINYLNINPIIKKIMNNIKPFYNFIEPLFLIVRRNIDNEDHLDNN